MSGKRSKPQGELVWVMDGKTEYMGQLLEPLSMVEREGNEDAKDVEIEVRWTHNGVIEWVTLDRVRVETPEAGEGRRRVRKPAVKASPEGKMSPSTTRSPKMNEAELVAKKRPAEEVEEQTTQPSEKSDNPPPKKQKVGPGDITTGADSFFMSLTSHVMAAKNALVSGFQEVFKELAGGKGE